MKSNLKIMIVGVWICAIPLSSLFSPGNNIRINGTVQVSQGLSFPLRRNNSWQDQFNRAAAWVFQQRIGTITSGYREGRQGL